MGNINHLSKAKKMLLDNNIHRKYFSLIDNHEKFKSKKEMSIAVVGAMKSGKSTIIDAFLGYDVMPNENEACTLTTTEIYNQDADFKIKKIYNSGEIEVIEAPNVYDIFHTEVRNTRLNHTEVDFTYEMNYPIYSFRNNHKKPLVTLIDTPGLNEMDGLGVSKNDIDDVFKNMILNCHHIILVLDYQYYKAEENKELIKKIREFRSDLIDGNLTVVINKVDKWVEKDGEINNVLEKIRKHLKEIDLNTNKIYPIVARKALYSRMIENNHNLDLVIKEILSYMPTEEKLVDGEVLQVKRDPRTFYKELFSESEFECLEADTIKRLGNTSQNSILNAIEVQNTFIQEKIIEDLNSLKEKLICKSNELAPSVLKLEDNINLVSGLIKYLNTEKKWCNEVLHPKNDDDLKKDYLFDASYCYRTEYEASESMFTYEFKGSSAAERSGKEAFKRWKNKIKIDYEYIYSAYSSYLDLDSNNEFKKLNSTVSNHLKDLENKLSETLQLIDSKILVSVQTIINIVPDPIMSLDFENSKYYSSDIYDNSTFVDSDSRTEYVSGIFGDKEKEIYYYKISYAMKNEEEDIKKALNNSSNNFFRDFTKKYITYINRLNKTMSVELDGALSKVLEIQKQLSDSYNHEPVVGYNTLIREISNIETLIRVLNGEELDLTDENMQLEESISSNFKATKEVFNSDNTKLINTSTEDAEVKNVKLDDVKKSINNGSKEALEVASKIIGSLFGELNN